MEQEVDVISIGDSVAPRQVPFAIYGDRKIGLVV